MEDEWQRYYWASPADLPNYNTYDRIIAGRHPWVLGVPASGCTPGVTVDGGGDAMQVGYPDGRAWRCGISDYRPGNSIFLMPIVPTARCWCSRSASCRQSTDADD